MIKNDKKYSLNNTIHRSKIFLKHNHYKWFGKKYLKLYTVGKKLNKVYKLDFKLSWQKKTCTFLFYDGIYYKHQIL